MILVFKCFLYIFIIEISSRLYTEISFFELSKKNKRDYSWGCERRIFLFAAVRAPGPSRMSPPHLSKNTKAENHVFKFNRFINGIKYME